jgi:26S proteasome regulatory subunit N2
MIALNTELKMPKLNVKSDAKPSLFAYTANLVEEKKKKHGPITKAVLSTAGKKAKHAKKEGDADGAGAMDIDSPSTDKDSAEKKTGETEEEKKEEEKAFEMLTNPARVTADQEKHVVWEDERYRPITPV